MKRYRCLSFYLDCIRNSHDKGIIKDFVAGRYGNDNLDEKLARYMAFKPPPLRAQTEYHDLLQEIEDAYVYGLYYPSITAACCLGERILNIFILQLRSHYKTSEHYKNVHQHDSFDNWEKSIKVLEDWKVIENAAISAKYKQLARFRRSTIHFGALQDIENQCLEVLKIVYDITTYFFGFGVREDFYFWVQGEIYIRKEAEDLPFVKVMLLRYCAYVGHRHLLDCDAANSLWVVKDNHQYGNEYITDDNFIKLRTERRDSPL